jgi:protein O-GlcNAc transferase
LARTQQAGRGGVTARVAEQFALAIRHHQAGRLADAEHLYRQIRAVDPNHVGSLHLGGVAAHQLGRRDAVDLIERAVALKPELAEAHNDLGVVLGAQGRFTEAVASFERAIVLNPNYAEAYNNLGSALGSLGRFVEATACFERSLAINPSFAMAQLYLGNALRAQGKLDQAVTHYERAVAIDPKFAIAHYNLASTVKEQGRIDAAVDHYRHALALMPNSAEGHNNLGLALKELGRLDEAVAHYRRAVALKPDFAGAHNNLANALKELGKLNEATAHYDQSLALAPDFAPAHYNYGVLYRSQSKFSEAMACFERALAIKPDFIEAKFALCMAQLPILYMDEAEIERRRADYRSRLTALSDDVEWAERPGEWADMIGAHQPFYLAYQGLNDRDLQAMYGSFVCRIMADRYEPAILPPPPAPDERVRVGIVSGFFRHHSNWKIPIKGWLSQLDRRQFQLFGYHTGTEQDAETEAAATLCDRFIQGPLLVDRWRHTIAADAVHVLIYPEVGMDRVSAQLAAQRLAPVQCVSWGHPDTSGFPTLDYYLSGELMEPPEAQDHYTERLIRLPNLSIYIEPPDAQPVSLGPSDLGLRATATVFWCGQAVYKYLPQFDQVLPRIALETGDCQFIFIEFPGAPHITELLRKRLEQAFASLDLNAADYCVVLPRLDPKKFVAAIGQCDIMLDSIGWSGCNSTLDSLIHNIPIVTMTGALMRGRHTAAILKMMGVAETVVATIDEYVAAAVRLAGDEALRTAIKVRISQNKRRVYRDRTCITALEEFLNETARRGDRHAR